MPSGSEEEGERSMNTSTESLQSALASLAVGSVRPADETDAVMGVRSRVVVEPETEEEVAALLRCADERRLAVLPRGGGTHLTMGNAPRSGDILLSMARLNQIIEHTPHDQTVTVQAGMRLVDLQAALGRTRQWLALDPPHTPDATIGGLISTNVSGPRRLRYGGVRDQLIGVRVVLPDGTIARGGGKVVKNVAGYDLPKLYCGALGTLGIIVAASFRLYPLAVASRTVVIEARSPAPLCDLVVRILASTLVPSALDVLGATDTEAHTLAVRFESGVAEAVDEQVAAVLAMAGGDASGVRTLADEDESAFWHDSQRLALATDAVGASGGRPPAPAACTLKASLLPAEVAGCLDDLAAGAVSAGIHASWAAHVGHGLVMVRLAGRPVDAPRHSASSTTGAAGSAPTTLDALASAILQLREAAKRRRGTLVVTDAPPALASRVDVWGPVSAPGVMRRLKQQFDPHGILNPGRFACDI